MVQILGGLITYLLLAIYCHEQHNEKVSIKRVRELRCKIKNESTELRTCRLNVTAIKCSEKAFSMQKRNRTLLNIIKSFFTTF